MVFTRNVTKERRISRRPSSLLKNDGIGIVSHAVGMEDPTLLITATLQKRMKRVNLFNTSTEQRKAQRHPANTMMTSFLRKQTLSKTIEFGNKEWKNKIKMKFQKNQRMKRS